MTHDNSYYNIRFCIFNFILEYFSLILHTIPRKTM